MKHKKHYLLIPLLTCLSANTFAYSECERKISKIWNSLSESTAVWISFTDGGGAITKAESQLTEGQMERFYSLLLTAQAQNKPIIVRYPEDGLVCPPNSTTRSDVLGVWITKQ